MIKTCEICGIEIADTSIDAQGRFNAVRYCQECAAARKKQQDKHNKQRQRAREKAERSLLKADVLLQQQQEIQAMKDRERELLAEVARLKHEKTVEQQQAATIRKLQAEIAERQTRSAADAVQFMRLYQQSHK